MNIMGMPSDHLAAIRDKVKTMVHDGLRLTPEDTSAFVRHLNTVAALVKEVEEENMVLTHALGARRDALRDRRGDPDVTEAGENIVPLGRRVRPRLVTDSDGGDAA